MKSLEIPNLPDEVYAQIEDAAKRRGLSVVDEAIQILKQGLAVGDKEALLLAEARENREELARRGFFATPEDLNAAINRGRE